MKEKVEDTVKDLWIASMEEGRKITVNEVEPSILRKLMKEGYAKMRGSDVVLTPKGLKLGEEVVRLHRLTERLLLDVLGMEEKVFEEASCAVEHVITKELEEAICTLLWHPKVCPHGKQIPPGSCCNRRREKISRVVFSLNELKPGEEGRVGYIALDRFSILSRLMSLGLSPGARLKLLRKTPSYIVQVGRRQIAFDKYIASSIYVVKAPIGQ